MAISYILCSFGTFLPVLVSRTKKNLATLFCCRGLGTSEILNIGMSAYSVKRISYYIIAKAPKEDPVQG
jgi:hypothetical protein